MTTAAQGTLKPLDLPLGVLDNGIVIGGLVVVAALFAGAKLWYSLPEWRRRQGPRVACRFISGAAMAVFLFDLITALALAGTLRVAFFLGGEAVTQYSELGSRFAAAQRDLDDAEARIKQVSAQVEIEEQRRTSAEAERDAVGRIHDAITALQGSLGAAVPDPRIEAFDHLRQLICDAGDPNWEDVKHALAVLGWSADPDVNGPLAEVLIASRQQICG